MVPGVEARRDGTRLGVASIMLGVLGLVVGPGAIEASRRLSELTLRGAVIGIAAASTLLGAISLYLSRRARIRYEWTLGRGRGRGAALAGRILGTLAVAVGIAASIALLVYGLLVYRSH
ncbi:MAG: hypothetical protein ACXVZP_09110 [Gaiellaceae bacterium]